MWTKRVVSKLALGDRVSVHSRVTPRFVPHSKMKPRRFSDTCKFKEQEDIEWGNSNFEKKTQYIIHEVH